MAVPTHVKAAVSAISGFFCIFAIRDIFSPAMPIMPDDEIMMKWFFDGNTPPLREPFLMISHFVGVMLLAGNVPKLVTVHTAQEGTFLRRNLFVAYGLFDIFMGALLYTHEGALKDVGGTFLPYLVLMMIEGGILLHDALLRERKTKKRD